MESKETAQFVKQLLRNRKCHSLTEEGDLGGLEPRGSTKSHHVTELKWEVWGERGAEAASEQEKKEGGREGFAVYKGI